MGYHHLPDPHILQGPPSPRSHVLHYSKTPRPDYFPVSFDFSPICGSWLSLLAIVTPLAFFLMSHQIKPAHFAKLSNSDLSCSAVFSLFDLLLFKLYSVMFYTIIDNKIALEPFFNSSFFFFRTLL